MPPATPRHSHPPTSRPAHSKHPEMTGKLPEMTPQEFGRWRHVLRLSQQRAGEMLGISRVSVSAFERGTAPVDVRTALACRWLLAVANWHVDVNERRAWMRAIGRWTA